MGATNLPANFEIIGTRGFYRPVAKVSFEQAMEMIMRALDTARTLGLESLLVNAQGITGHEPPTVLGRHAFAVRWAESAGSELLAAFVTRPEMLDPQRIGVVMAQNRGAAGDVFTDEAVALAWLDSRYDDTSD